MSELYVYALVDRGATVLRAAGRRIEFMKVGSVYAAIERISARPPVSEAALRAQHGVVARIADKVDAILPARFGSVVDAAELERIIRARSEVIEEALDLVRGRAQMTLRVSGGRGAVAPGGAMGSGSGSGARRGADSLNSRGTSYLHDRRAAMVPQVPPEILDPISAATEGTVVATRVGTGPRSAGLTFYQLIDRGDDDKYRRAISSLTTVQQAALKVSGPWPPFAFAPELWP